MFSAFEWLVAMRYLGARRQEGFVSVIAVFSFLGITLGVAALIIVMSVMNGFRHELLTRILGVNGHITVYGYNGKLVDFEPLAAALSDIDGVVRAMPIIDGQVLATAPGGQTAGAMVRGLTGADLAGHAMIAAAITAGAIGAVTAIIVPTAGFVRNSTGTAPEIEIPTFVEFELPSTQNRQVIFAEVPTDV